MNLEAPIKCSPSGVQLAENLRTLANMVEAGEVDAVAMCAVMSSREPSDDIMASVIWAETSYFELISASAVLHQRVLHKFVIPEALHHYHEGPFTLGQPIPPADPDDE